MSSIWKAIINAITVDGCQNKLSVVLLRSLFTLTRSYSPTPDKNLWHFFHASGGLLLPPRGKLPCRGRVITELSLRKQDWSGNLRSQHETDLVFQDAHKRLLLIFTQMKRVDFIPLFEARFINLNLSLFPCFLFYSVLHFPHSLTAPPPTATTILCLRGLSASWRLCKGRVVVVRACVFKCNVLPAA